VIQVEGPYFIKPGARSQEPGARRVSTGVDGGRPSLVIDEAVQPRDGVDGVAESTKTK
jgi:hypothetical protein